MKKNTFKCDSLHFAIKYCQIDNRCQILAIFREQLSPSPTAFSISRYFRALRPHASTVEDDLIVFKEEEYNFYMVQCLDYGDPLTAGEIEEVPAPSLFFFFQPKKGSRYLYFEYI